MFHQANLVPTNWTTDPTDPLYVTPTPTDDPSLIEYWHIRVLGELSKYLNTDAFPVQVRCCPAKPRRGTVTLRLCQNQNMRALRDIRGTSLGYHSTC